jgi:phage terminase large subunit
MDKIAEYMLSKFSKLSDADKIFLKDRIDSMIKELNQPTDADDIGSFLIESLT